MEVNKILLVDDIAVNLEIVTTHLCEQGYKVFAVTSGEKALIAAEKIEPDLVIMDIVLPGIDGYETCRRFKSNDSLVSIPIIFLSKLEDTEAKIKGFEAGGNDYISKPIHKGELCARVKNHLMLRKYNLEMKMLAEERAKALVHADRLATLGTLCAGVSHEINNPATFISIAAQTLADIWEKLAPLISNSSLNTTESNQLIKAASKSIPNAIKNINNGVTRIAGITRSLKNYSRKEISCRLFDVNSTITQALELCNNRLLSNVGVKKMLNSSLPPVCGDVRQIEQVIVNLVINASDSVEENRSGEIEIITEMEQDYIVIKIYDTGTGIPDELLDKIWEPFYTTKSSEKGTGLGLFICKNIITGHGGEINVENRENNKGTVFTIKLPVIKECNNV